MYIYFHSMAIYVCIYVYIYVYKHTHLWLAALAASRKCVRPPPPFIPRGPIPPGSLRPLGCWENADQSKLPG